MSPEQSEAEEWKEIPVGPDEETFVVAWRNKVYIATSAWSYDRDRDEDREAIAQLDTYLRNGSADPAQAAVMRVSRMTVMQAVGND